MSDPLKVLRSRLLAIPAVTAIVGSRVYAGLLPTEPVLPAVAMQVIDRVESFHLRGKANDTSRRVQVHAVAKTRSAAAALADACEGNGAGSALSGFSGTAGGARVKAIVSGGTERELYRAAEFDEYEVIRDYIVHLN